VIICFFRFFRVPFSRYVSEFSDHLPDPCSSVFSDFFRVPFSRYVSVISDHLPDQRSSVFSDFFRVFFSRYVSEFSDHLPDQRSSVFSVFFRVSFSRYVSEFSDHLPDQRSSAFSAFFVFLSAAMSASSVIICLIRAHLFFPFFSAFPLQPPFTRQTYSRTRHRCKWYTYAAEIQGRIPGVIC
jgi:hypothetical protein